MNNYWPLLGYRSYPRWVRQRVVRGNEKLRLYRYASSGDIRESQPIATVVTNENGEFDFGAMREGQYALVVDWPFEYSSFFDVEIRKLRVETSAVRIDVSPVNPDCGGGHEFISYSK